MSVNRGCRIVAALCVLFLGGSLAGCSLLGTSKVSSDDIRAMKNIPEGQKNTLISRMEAASSASERAEIGQQAVTLNKMIGTKLLMKEPPIAYQRTYELKRDVYKRQFLLPQSCQSRVGVSCLNVGFVCCGYCACCDSLVGHCVCA